ncbi:hypothetical protein HZS38_09310 [Xenorhabdus nematophila]|uniref:hypothetical protein n=1 Tax=Xenorhabdus nematophila TaxID=628 RepID=UPI000542B9DA|nr:hypothetical protein [Xenorhabdus nematophila]CEF32171.1 hypothetical protein XNW1_4260001 [Xenorhabdus nematophila str. Websteri]AYA40582.1 hypothetical protein D3790_09225 [Xenorhabdus nematophila]KHD29233.1 hypothetical protein LH67_04020 [Xenorhabdus nematophila]MBA0019320.1 hypothetical protein [Xenorhabdus nematophila]MCB4424155.1 hypothetical protein [Xenorhabdus nematophila]
MARPFNFPSPQSVLIGNPTMFVPAELAISLYNQDPDNQPAKNFSQSVKDWFIREVRAIGWNHAGATGDNTGILLIVNVRITPNQEYMINP